MTQKSGAPSRAAAATLKEPVKMPSGGGCSEQCKKETWELKATIKKMEKAMEELQTAMAATQLTIEQQRGVIDQQRDAIRRLQEGGSRNEANDNKMATDADEEDNGTPTEHRGQRLCQHYNPLDLPIHRQSEGSDEGIYGCGGKRDVIAVQETHTEDTSTLPGYWTHACPPSARTCGKGAVQGVCTFIRKGIAHVKHQHFLGSRDTANELCVTKLAISGKGRRSPGRKKEEDIDHHLHR
ncbi:hypothetical protein HPB51_024325 [Rhipicephalus microplus]|uniref:Uncharacterized protein n=1 Tax=Rhipicephalus microplus TaxID=6941 RepID=A0A9J6DYF0_RHIMP|nr:hypothetical protein HPB51_024325 [Rhipicephalus microplus]